MLVWSTSTWTPAANRCNSGTGRLYGLAFDDCNAGLDTNGDGSVDSSDNPSIATTGAYISGITVTDAGTILYGSSGVTTDGTSGAVGTLSNTTQSLLGDGYCRVDGVF